MHRLRPFFHLAHPCRVVSVSVEHSVLAVSLPLACYVSTRCLFDACLPCTMTNNLNIRRLDTAHVTWLSSSGTNKDHDPWNWLGLRNDEEVRKAQQEYLFPKDYRVITRFDFFLTSVSSVLISWVRVYLGTFGTRNIVTVTKVRVLLFASRSFIPRFRRMKIS